MPAQYHPPPSYANHPNVFLIEWVLLLSILLLLAASMGWSLYNEYQGIDQRERERLATQAKVIHDNLSRQLDGVNRALLSVRDSLPEWNSERGGMAQAGYQLKAFVDAMPSLRVMTILDAEGVVRVASHSDIPPGTNFRERSYFQAALKNPDPNTLYISPPFKTSLGVWGVNVVRMVPGPEGEFTGLVSATLDPDEFKILLESVRYADDMRASLVHGNGDIFLLAPAAESALGKNLAQPGTMFSRHLESAQRATVMRGFIMETGDQRLIAQQTLQPAELVMDHAINIAVSRDLDALYTPWQREANFRGGLIALLTLISLPGLYWLQRRRRFAQVQANIVENALREKSQELENFFNISIDLLGIFDAQGRFYKLNPAWEKTLGYSIAELEGRHYIEFVHPDDRAMTNSAQAELDHGQSILQFTNRYRTKSGEYRYIEWHSIPFHDRCYSAARDITERIKRESLLQAATVEAEAASVAKSAFLANMSHEIRTPLNAVLGLLQLLQYTALDGRQLDYSKKARGAAESLLAILNDILDFSKVEAGKMTLEDAAFRLDELLRNLSVVLSAALHNKEVEVLFQLDPAIPRALRGDGLRLQQVLLNLAGNAIKFTERGEVIVSLRLLESTSESVRIEFGVRDTGIGIPADRLTAVFEGFTQAESSTTRRYGGTGLGLAISQRMVRLMGGQLAAESTPGQGSYFYFTLDFARDETDQTDESSDKRVLNNSVRVLIVDDNAIAREVLSRMASSFGWQVETAASGEEAIDRLRQDSATGLAFDVIFMDWIMPGMDGWEAVQHIRAMSFADHMPAILMVTAHGQELLAERLTKGPSLLDAFLVKPVTPSMLFDAVAQVTHGSSVSVDHPMAERSTANRPLTGLRLLVVEDNPLNQQVAQELLSHVGAYVQVANDGQQGVDRVQAAQPPFDAVLMDIQMPGMDGYEATRILRTELSVTLPIIAMTANAMPADRNACLAAGMTDHVGKPIDIAQLSATLLRHCRPDFAPATHSPTGDPAQPLPPLPVLPNGFDLPAALARLGQNRPLFASLVRRFDSDQVAIVARARQYLQQGDRSGTARELHTLKGLAATLGALHLARCAADIEARIKNGTDSSTEDRLFEELDACLHEATTTLYAATDAFDLPLTPAESFADPARIREQLSELESLLAERNMRALDIHAAIRREAGGMLGEHLIALNEAMDQLDFAAAREKIANLKGWLKS